MPWSAEEKVATREEGRGKRARRGVRHRRHVLEELELVESDFQSAFPGGQGSPFRWNIQQEGTGLEDMENFLSARAAVNRAGPGVGDSLCPGEASRVVRDPTAMPIN